MSTQRSLQKALIISAIIITNLVAWDEASKEQVLGWVTNSAGFEENLGQVCDFEGNLVSRVYSRIDLKDFSLFITDKGASFVIYKRAKTNNGVPLREEALIQDRDATILHYARIDLELLNASIRKTNISYEEELPGYTNYYLPSCPKGILYLKRYQKIRIREIYSGIDWVFKIADAKLHHEFEIAPGADISRIKIKVKWADIEIKEDGKSMVLKTPLASVVDGELVAYELKDENLAPVKAFYQKEDDNIIGFKVLGYSGSSTLIIDPPLSLLWATRYGGGSDDYGYSITTDDSGNVFVTGLTYSYDFPTYDPGAGAYYDSTYDGIRDLFLLKFTNTGVRQWATYYGGGDDDYGHSITTDASGNVFVTGKTQSTDFPIYDPGGSAYYDGTLDGWRDLFLLKFTNTGIRQWATYYGGNNFDTGSSIFTDASGNVFVTGVTASTDFPIYDPGGGAYYDGTHNGGWYDLFLLKFTNTGIRQWATYYGGNDDDYGYSITTNDSGNIFVTGYTESTDFPTHNPGGGAYYDGTLDGVSDLVLLKFTNPGVRQWATYYGGSAGERSYSDYSIFTDASGNVFVTGVTASTDFPIYDPGGGAYYDGTLDGGVDLFLLKFTNPGVRQWATYYGGTGYDYGSSITTDAFGNVFVTGWTYSTDFPVYDPGGGAYYDGTHNGGWYDLFLLKFTNTGARQWATYYGGSSADFGSSITTDASGNVFVTGWTSSADFPTHKPGSGAYYDGTHNGGWYNLFLLKFEGSAPGVEEEQVAASSSLLRSSTFFKDKLVLRLLSPPGEPIEINLYNAIGEKVLEKVYPADYSITISGKEIHRLQKGVYFLILKSGNRILGKVKLIKV